MKPKIDRTKFGSITIAGDKFDHDVQIRLDGQVQKRKKRLSKEIYGTSHILSLPEAEVIYEAGARLLLVGSGQIGMVSLSPEAAQFFKEHDVKVELLPTPQAIRLWNESPGPLIGLFHVTC